SFLLSFCFAPFLKKYYIGVLRFSLLLFYHPAAALARKRQGRGLADLLFSKKSRHLPFFPAPRQESGFFHRII
ncbi:MAG: hypothetical protein J6N99_04985, partial [Schwartzia sp.]|nr:hypothetical protein [Schwartzia sp. (in: firmicutes)]